MIASVDLGNYLKERIDEIKPLLDGIDENEAAVKSDPARWSKKEILGHLIDSACNNQRRFVIAQEQEHLHFDGYSQDLWVANQNFQDRPWDELVETWYFYNRHVASTIAVIPSNKLEHQTVDHNLDRIAFKVVPNGEVTSLSYFIRDYILHLQHHIDQILTEENT